MQYMTDVDRTNMVKFFQHCLAFFTWPPPTPLYHYTTANNFIRIVESGDLWATHIACLNDTMEVQYTIEELTKRVKKLQSAESNSKLAPLYRCVLDRLANIKIEAFDAFVTCFSELPDDLNQWRVYSGGEGGCAIEFDSTRLRNSGVPHTYLVKVSYNVDDHDRLFDTFLRTGAELFLKMDGRSHSPSEELWANEFVEVFGTLMAHFAACFKHPKFADEKEWRVLRVFHEGDLPTLRFQQRNSMITRHLPIGFNKSLPISGVVVGPGKYPSVFRAGVIDILRVGGYEPCKLNITSTEVPYRAV